MKKIKFQIRNTQGIHAMPAMLLVNHFTQSKCNIFIEKGEKVVNAKKLFALMSLYLKQGDTITITFEGEGEEVAVKAAEGYLKENL